jgi:uncharacterized membrane protein YphA (DoxX/SURF4 family)
MELKKILLHTPWPYRVARLGLSLVFIWAGTVKLMDPRAFARTISGYGLLPEFLLVPAAIGIPVLELVSGLGLAFDVRGSLKVIGGLLLLFLGVLGFGIIRELDVDCGCFSAEELRSRDSLRIAFYRDLVLMGVVSYLFCRRWVQARMKNACTGMSEANEERRTV